MVADLPTLIIPPHAHLDREDDCAIWALAALTSSQYEDVLIAAAQEDKLGGTKGLHVSQIQRIAAKLGFPLKLKLKNIDFDDETGILSVWILDRKGKRYGHVCVLKKGQVIDSIGGISITDVDVYTDPTKCVVHGLLIPVQP